MTLLTMLNGVADECGVARPQTVIAGTDATTRRLLTMANREGRSLAKLDWPVLRKEKTFTSTAAETQTSAVPSDWSRFTDRTFWNRTLTQALSGPLSPQEWQAAKALTNANVNSFTYRGVDILITPNPTAGQTMAYEYFSKNWCQSSGAVGQVVWTADTDTGILDEDLMARGVTWRFKKASGMEWVADFNDYMKEVRMAFTQSGPAANFDMAGDTWAGPPPGVYTPPRDLA